MGGSSHLLPDQPKLAAPVIIREHRPEDDEVYARLLTMQMAATFDVELLRDRWQRWSQKYWFMRIAELDGQVVGILELCDAGTECGMLRIVVDPEYRGRGIGTALLQTAIANPVFAERKAFAEVGDNDPLSLRFAQKLGYQHKAHAYESTIDPAEFDISPFQPYIDRVLESGLKFTTVAELGDTEEVRYKLWEIEHVTDADIPGIDMDLLPTWEDAKKSWFTSFWYKPANAFVVLDGDQWVASSATAELSPGIWYVQQTCVLREYRGRGLATAVKALATEHCRKQGSRLLKTNNHEGNEPMLAISRKFGFKPQPGWYELIRPRHENGES